MDGGTWVNHKDAARNGKTSLIRRSAPHLGLRAHPPPARPLHRAGRGGLSLDGARWITCRPGFFLPVRVLSRLFRRLVLEQLAAAHEAGRLHFFGDHAALAGGDAFTAYLAPLRTTEWVVYSKRPFGGPEAVLAYLARYTHRVAIANSQPPRPARPQRQSYGCSATTSSLM